MPTIPLTDQLIKYPAAKMKANMTLLEKLPEWLRNFKTNMNTIGFNDHIGNLPRLQRKKPALIIDHPFSGSLEKHLATLNGYRGTIFCCDRALWKILPYVTPTYVVNVDSSYLCLSFFDRPDVREHMPEITAIFATTTFPLTIRSWHGKRVFFTPYFNDSINGTLSKVSGTPSLYCGGCVHNTSWVIAYVLGANPIGLLGIENSYDNPSQTEYPGVKHEKVRTRYGAKYVDPVYKTYDKILKELAEEASKNGRQTINCSQNGITYSDHISDMNLKDFIKHYGGT